MPGRLGWCTVRRIGRWCGWAALALLLLALLTGYGVSEFRIVTGATLGVLTRPPRSVGIIS